MNQLTGIAAKIEALPLNAPAQLCSVKGLKALAAEVKRLTEENARLREGLEHYGSADSWLCEVCEMPDYNCTPFVHRANILDTPDNGYDHARKILAELEGK